MPKGKSATKKQDKNRVEVINVKSEMEADKLNKHLQQEKPSCVIYLMEGCPHCVILKNTLDKELEPILKSRNGGIIAKIYTDLMDHLNIENRNVEGFPTITIVKNGKQTKEHNGPRNVEAILDFLADSNVIDDVSMVGGTKRKTYKSRKTKTTTKKARACCRSCKTCSKCSCKCKKSCKSCKCKCKHTTFKRKTKKRKYIKI